MTACGEDNEATRRLTLLARTSRKINKVAIIIMNKRAAGENELVRIAGAFPVRIMTRRASRAFRNLPRPGLQGLVRMTKDGTTGIQA
eukprot:GSA120T00005545001.1